MMIAGIPSSSFLFINQCSWVRCSVMLFFALLATDSRIVDTKSELVGLKGFTHTDPTETSRLCPALFLVFPPVSCVPKCSNEGFVFKKMFFKQSCYKMEQDVNILKTNIKIFLVKGF